MKTEICEEASRNHPLADVQKASNRRKSKIRSRFEHVLSFIERSMGGQLFRGVGILRDKTNVALANPASYPSKKYPIL